jgi:tRNA (adenine22-N1)-methyltransferase
MDPAEAALSPRLAAIAGAIERGSRVADIGSDHGLLPLWLAANDRAEFCLVTERTETLLARVARPPAGSPWSTRLRYRAGDGLTAVHPADRVDTVVLAGLGGRTIVGILGANPPVSPTLRRLVLQPRSETALTRRWLADHGWRPISEQLTIERRRFHVTIVAIPGADLDLYRHPVLSREDLLHAGPLLARSRLPAVDLWWRSEKERFSSILARSRRSGAAAEAAAGLARAERLLAVISSPAG